MIGHGQTQNSLHLHDFNVFAGQKQNNIDFKDVTHVAVAGSKIFVFLNFKDLAWAESQIFGF